MADQRITASYSSRYTFTGKEQDALTGLHYFGARYYDARISLWYGVDPMAEKYPSWNPFNYTMNNPIRFTDPTGMEVEGDIYNNKGVHIGNDGKADQKVFLLNSSSDKQLTQQQSLEMTNAVSNIHGDNPCVNVCFDGAEMTQVPITNDELNLRSTLTTLSKAEAGSSNAPLEYNSWNHGATFSDNTKHPGINPASGSSASGFYQAMVDNFVGTDFSPQSQDKFAVNLMTSKSYNAALSGNMTDFQSAAKGRWTSLQHWTGAELQPIFNANRANELIGVSRIASSVGSAVGLRGKLKI